MLNRSAPEAPGEARCEVRAPAPGNWAASEAPGEVRSEAEATAPGARRHTRRGAATRELIISAAATLIFEKGVARTSIDDIRRATGVSGSQMTHYFADKQALVRAVIEHQVVRILHAHRQPQLGRLDSFAALRAWADMVLETQRRHQYSGGCPLGTLVSQLAADPVLRHDLAAGFARWQALLADGLEQMRWRGELRADADPAQLALALLTALQGGLLLTSTRQDPTPLDAALTAALFYVRSFATELTTPAGLPGPPTPPV